MGNHGWSDYICISLDFYCLTSWPYLQDWCGLLQALLPHGADDHLLVSGGGQQAGPELMASGGASHRRKNPGVQCAHRSWKSESRFELLREVRVIVVKPMISAESHTRTSGNLTPDSAATFLGKKKVRTIPSGRIWMGWPPTKIFYMVVSIVMGVPPNSWMVSNGKSH